MLIVTISMNLIKSNKSFESFHFIDFDYHSYNKYNIYFYIPIINIAY